MMRILLVSDPVSGEALKTALGFSHGACSKCAVASTFEIATAQDIVDDDDITKGGIDFVLLEFDPSRAKVLLTADAMLETRHVPHAFYTKTMVESKEPLKAPLWAGNGFRLDLISKIVDHYLAVKGPPKKTDCVTHKSGI